MIRYTALKYLLIVLVLSLLAGCDKSVEIDRTMLMKKTEIYKEPKVAIWYYRGSDDKYDYFLYRDLGIEAYYKVKKEEKTITDKIRFSPPATEDSVLIVMPWGIHKSKL